jgi:hypothetical protein
MGFVAIALVGSGIAYGPNRHGYNGYSAFRIDIRS